MHWSDLHKGQGTLCSHEQIKVSQWLILIGVARQQLTRVIFFLFQATKATADTKVFSVNLTSWYSPPSFLSANEKHPFELSKYQIHGGSVSSAGF